MTEVLSWLLFGLLAGAAAQLVLPGRTTRLGCLGTIAVGMAGALIGGVLGDVVLDDEDTRFEWDVGPFLLAVVGAVIFLLVLDAISRRGRPW